MSAEGQPRDDRGFVPEIEQQLLGAILSGGNHAALFALLDEQHFIEPAHQLIFEAARRAHHQYSSTTIPVVLRLLPPTFADQFKVQTGQGIGLYLAEAASSTIYSSGTTGTAARAVIAQWARISLAAEAGVVSEAAKSADADPLAIMRSFGETMDTLSSPLRRGGRGNTRKRFASAAADAVEYAREAKTKKGLTGITTGLADLDRATGGLQRRDLTLIGARPSMGKTTLGTSIALSAARAGSGVGFFSLEMDTPKLTLRMCSDLAFRRAALVPYEGMLNGSSTDEDVDVIEQMMADFLELPLWIDDASGLTITDIRVKTEAMAAEADRAGTRLDVVVIDHLTKVRPSQRYAGNRVNEIGEVTDGLKEIARELDISVLLLSQLSRAVEARDDKRPTLADLRDSGAIEQDADAVMFLFREAYYLSREKPASADKQIERDERLKAAGPRAELDIAKQRNGRTQTIELFANMACSHFGNAARAGYREMHERFRG